MKGNIAPPSRRRTLLAYAMGIFAILVLFTFYEDFLRTSNASLDTNKLSVLYVENTGSCNNVQMFGIEEDAGWWLCWPEQFHPTKDNCKVLSWGIQDHFSFDEAVVHAGCEVHGFDPSPLALASNNKYTNMGGKFHSYGLGAEDKTYGPGQVPFNWPGIKYLKGSNSDPWTLRSIPTVMRDTGANAMQQRNGANGGGSDGKTLLVFKIDVEGTEWNLIDQIVEADWDQLLLELHFPPAEYHLSPAGESKGFVITRLPQSGLMSYLFPPKLDYIDLWSRVMKVGSMWKYHFNLDDRSRACLEVYLVRKR